MKTFIFSAAIAFASLTASVANAQVIFDAVVGDAVTTFSNPQNAPPSFATNSTTATLTNTAGISHFVSINDIQTLNGGTPLTATDVVTITWVVDGITGYVNDDPATTANPNGIEYGVLPNATLRSTQDNVGTLTRFRGDHPNIANANKVGYGFGNLSVDGPAQTENEPTVEGRALDDGNAANGDEAIGLEGTGESFADGFTVVQTISAAGFTTQYRDIVVTQLLDDGTGAFVRSPNGGTVLTTEIAPFPTTGFDFVTFINGAHFYAGTDTDRTAGTGAVVTFSAARIEINAAADCVLGDVDLSGSVDFDDISPFITLLANGGNQCEADVNESGNVDFDDIAPFITILAGP